jgi:hypothetical protein
MPSYRFESLYMLFAFWRVALQFVGVSNWNRVLKLSCGTNIETKLRNLDYMLNFFDYVYDLS